MNKCNLKDEIFLREYGCLYSNLRICKWQSLYYYFFMPLFRFIFGLIPVLLMSMPVIQFVVLLIANLFNTVFIAHSRFLKSFEEYFLEVFNNFFFMVMIYHIPIFMDGGLINGIPVKYDLEQILKFKNLASISFMSVGILIIAVNIFFLAKSI